VARTRIAFALLGLSIVVVSFILMSSEAIWQEFEVLIFIAAMLAISCGPFVLYLALVRSRPWTLTVGLLLGAATVVTNAMVLTDEHSTAPMGFLTSMIVNYVIVVVGIALDSTQRQTE
jgi:hypothetical protein